jgi:hypothetical protein
MDWLNIIPENRIPDHWHRIPREIMVPFTRTYTVPFRGLRRLLGPLERRSRLSTYSSRSPVRLHTF